eukprot:12813006-Alexandrium_andersonii.AAC.1
MPPQHPQRWPPMRRPPQWPFDPGNASGCGRASARTGAPPSRRSPRARPTPEAPRPGKLPG